MSTVPITSPSRRRVGTGSTGVPPMSRAAALASKLAQQEQAAQQTQLTVEILNGRGILRRVEKSATTQGRTDTYTPAPTTPSNQPTTPSAAGGPAGSINEFATFVTFQHLDGQRSYVESVVDSGSNPAYDLSSTVALDVSETLLAHLSSTPLTVSVYEAATQDAVAAAAAAVNASIPALREGSPSPAPFRSDAPALNLASVAGGSSSTLSTRRGDEEKEDGFSVSTTEKRPGLLLGTVQIPLSSLLNGQQLIEGWYPLVSNAPYTPPANFFAPDPDLGQPELLVPFALHQSQAPPDAAAADGGKHSSRGSAPGTPEKGAKRSTSREPKGKAAAIVAPPTEVAPAVVEQPQQPPQPAEIFVTIRLSRPLLSEQDAAQGTMVSLSLPSLSSLPTSWLADSDALEAEKLAATQLAEAAIQAWKKKGSKKPPPADKSKDGKGKKSAAGVGGTPELGAVKDPKSSPAGDKKREKERLKELELKQAAERLNAVWRYTLSLAVPLGNGQSWTIATAVEKLELAKETPPQSPLTQAQALSGHLAGQGSLLELPSLAGQTTTGSDVSPRPTSGQNSARKPGKTTTATTTGGGGGLASGDATARSTLSGTGALNSPGGLGSAKGTNAGATGGGASGVSAKAQKKAEEEARVREEQQAQELQQQKLQKRMRQRYVPFATHCDIFLSAAGVKEWIDLAQSNGGKGIPITLIRELVSIDPHVPKGKEILQRDEFIAYTNVDLKGFLKMGSTTLKSILPVRIDPDVVQKFEQERERQLAAMNATQAAQGHTSSASIGNDTGRDGLGGLGLGNDGSISPAPSTSDEKSDSGAGAGVPKRKSSSIKKSGRAGGGKEKGSKDETTQPIIPSGPPADPYVQAKTVLEVDLQLSKPLVPLVIKPVLSLSDIIPPRRVSPLPKPGPDEELSEELIAVVKQLALEYDSLGEQVRLETMEADGAGTISTAQREDGLTSALLYRLNQSGMYHALRERLKPICMKIHKSARAREDKPKAPSEQITFDQRISRLYTQCIERLHVTLNELFRPTPYRPISSVEFQPELPPNPELPQPDRSYESLVAGGNGFASEIRSSRQIALQSSILSRVIPAHQSGATTAQEASARLLVAALEAERQGDFARAARLHESRCMLEYSGKADGSKRCKDISDERSATHWFDFGRFQLRLRNMNTAGECFRRALSIFPSHSGSLLAYAAFSLELGDVDSAEICLRTFQTCLDEEVQQANELECLTLTALYAQAIDEPQQAQEAWEKLLALEAASASAIQDSSAAPSADTAPSATAGSFTLPLGGGNDSSAQAATGVPSTSSVAPPPIPGTQPTAVIVVPEELTQSLLASASTTQSGSGASVSANHPLLTAAGYLLSLSLPRLASLVLAHASLPNSPYKSILFARALSVRIGPSQADENDAEEAGLYTEAFSHLTHAITTASDHGQVVPAFALKGHLLYQQGKLDQALEAYETYQEWEPSDLDPLLLYRLATFYLRSGDASKARSAYLQLCQVAPSACAWLGVGECSMLLPRQVLASEQALIQANTLDTSHPEIWARLTAVSLINNRIELANQSLMQALKLECTHDELFRTVGNLYRAKGFIDLATASLERSLQLRDSPLVRMDLADVLLGRCQYELAEEQLQLAAVTATGLDVKAQLQERWQNLQKAMGRDAPPDESSSQEQEQQNGINIAAAAGYD